MTEAVAFETDAEAKPVGEQWLAPPIGVESKATTEVVKIDQKALDGIVDKITDGIGKLWHVVAVQLNDPVWEHSQSDLWGYSVLVGYIIKKYADKAEIVLLGMAILSILTVESLKATEYAKHQKAMRGNHGGLPAESNIPPGALA